MPPRRVMRWDTIPAMASFEDLVELRDLARAATARDKFLLDELRADIRELKSRARTIKPRATTSISLVASDGGETGIDFDPFHLRVVRVVDSSGETLHLDAVSPTFDLAELARRQIEESTALGGLMRDLGVSTLHDLSHMIPRGAGRADAGAAWIRNYRDLCEWAALYQCVCGKEYATDTLFVRDGFLRSNQFRGDLFFRMCEKMRAAIERASAKKRGVFLVGLAKSGKMLARYNLAMAIEELFVSGDPRMARVSGAMEKRAYSRPDYARTGDGAPVQSQGAMHLVRFGPRAADPVWLADVFLPQQEEAERIFGRLLSDSLDGFPVPLYPRCLQQAHEKSQMGRFDALALQDAVWESVRDALDGSEKAALDRLRLAQNLAARRYE